MLFFVIILQGACVSSSSRNHDLTTTYGAGGGGGGTGSGSSATEVAVAAAGTIVAADNSTTPEVTMCSFLKTTISADEPLNAGGSRRLLECEHCHKQFTSRFNLQRHQLIHTGAKPYECPLCQQRFNQSGHVKTHLRTRHPTHESGNTAVAVTADNSSTTTAM